MFKDILWLISDNIALIAPAVIHAQASVLHEAATAVYPESTLAWVTRAIFYDSVRIVFASLCLILQIEDDINKSMTLLEAQKAKANGIEHRASHKFSHSMAAAGELPMFLLAANMYTSLGLVDLTQRCGFVCLFYYSLC
jgi:hypothetical protein